MPGTAFMQRLQHLIDRASDMIPKGTPRSFTQLDMEVFQTLLELTDNDPLRQILERLYYKTKRIWLVRAIAAELDLHAEFRIFRHELEAIQIALLSGDPGRGRSAERSSTGMTEPAAIGLLASRGVSEPLDVRNDRH